MAIESGHIQISEFSKETIPQINWMLEDLFCRYGVNMPYFCLDYAFPDYSERPDWVSGYNFNLDWGEWGYWLTWFNNLLGLLFDTAKLPRWQMPDFSPGSWAMFNDYISELYQESEPKIFCHTYEKSVYGMTLGTRNGAKLRFTTTGQTHYNDAICMDSNSNCYYIALGYEAIVKRDKNGNQLVSKTTEYSSRIAIGADGYLYEFGTKPTGLPRGTVMKRDLVTLDVEATMPIVDYDLGNFEGFALDSDSYIYVISRPDNRIEKWDFSDGSVVASQTTTWSTTSSLAVVGSTLLHARWGNYFESVPTSLDESPTQWTTAGLSQPRGCSGIVGEDFVVCGYDTTDKVYKIGRYQTDGTKLWLYEFEP